MTQHRDQETAYYGYSQFRLRIQLQSGRLARLDFVTQYVETGSPSKQMQDIMRQLDEYFTGKRHEFLVELRLAGTAFQKSVWQALRGIPWGETRSYSEIASAIGRPRSCRAVGAAIGRNPVSIVIPCHRVIGADGSLRGFAAGMQVKQWLLDHEQGHKQ